MSIGDMLQAQRDAEDARRYRWLKSQHWSMGTVCVTEVKNIKLGVDAPSHERLDALIDAALAQSQGVNE